MKGRGSERRRYLRRIQRDGDNYYVRFGRPTPASGLVGRLPRLSSERQAELVRRYRELADAGQRTPEFFAVREELVRRNFGLLIATARQLKVRDPEVVADMLFTLWKCVEKYDPSHGSRSKVSTYMATGVRNTASKGERRVRDHARRYLTVGTPNIDVVYADNRRQEEESEWLTVAQQAMSKLRPEHRVVLRMRIWAGMTWEEIGAASDPPVTKQGACFRFQMAMRELRQEIEKMRGEPVPVKEGRR